MYCKNCGQQLPDGSRFCPNCGTDNAAASNTQQNTQQTTYTATVTGANGLTKRNIGICILLSIITCGIYAMVWLVQLADDLKTASGDAESMSGIMVLLLSIVTCGIYQLYWYYKAGTQINAAKSVHGLPTDSNASILYLVLGIFGFGIISYCLLQNELNNLAA